MIGIMFHVSSIAIATSDRIGRNQTVMLRLSAMTQMADEIRTLIADLYDDPEDFLKRPHQWFGGRSPRRAHGD